MAHHRFRIQSHFYQTLLPAEATQLALHPASAKNCSNSVLNFHVITAVFEKNAPCHNVLFYASFLIIFVWCPKRSIASLCQQLYE